MKTIIAWVGVVAAIIFAVFLATDPKPNKFGLFVAGGVAFTGVFALVVDYLEQEDSK